MPSKPKRSLASVVGAETYSVWVKMLRALVPDGRTHRLAPLVAGMLQYAVTMAEDNPDEEADEESVTRSLLDATEASDPSEVEDYLQDVVDQLFKDAKVKHERTSARGEGYSIAESVYEEFICWYNMPWE
jgi:hypothetical protein